MTTSMKNGVVKDDLVNFEKGRIKALQEERLSIQKKTFTKWMNSFLLKARMEVEDLFQDLADGKKLLKLLEIISGEKLGKPNNGKMRVHHIENVNKSLAFLHTKVRLESIGAEDIVDGNPRLILGLIWTIILRFQIQEIEIQVDEDSESSEKKSAKDALLLWCQRKTSGYANVNIVDFTGSWRSGLGFNALIHAHRPDLIHFNALQPTKHIDNLNNAFDTAENSLGIPRLLDAEDIDCQRPDEKSVLTYVASYYHTFARMKNELKGGRRIANIVGQIMEADNLKHNYEYLTTDLLKWINETINKLSIQNLPNNLDQIQKLLSNFKDYRTVEKPPKYKEKSDIEANYFNINLRLKELKQPIYQPPSGPHDIEKAWEKLEKSEHKLETRLREELLRQTQLEQLAIRFSKKSDLREGYLKDMIQVLSDKRYGVNIGQVEATLKKHEAISADIMAREQRCKQLLLMSDSLEKENYHGKDKIKQRADQIMTTWDDLIELLKKHRLNLQNYKNLNTLLSDIDSLNNEIAAFNFSRLETGQHLTDVEDLLQKHALIESQINITMGEQVKKLSNQNPQNNKEVSDKLKILQESYKSLLDNAKSHRKKLEHYRDYYRFLQDVEEEEAWINDKQVSLLINGKDLRSVLRLQQKLKNTQEELKGRKHEVIFEKANEVVVEIDDVQLKVDNLKELIKEFENALKLKENKLKHEAIAYQFYADANEIDSWVKEKLVLVKSKDYGEDYETATALLVRHKNVAIEIDAFSGDVDSLKESIKLVNRDVELDDGGGEEEWIQEQKLVPQEYWEEEPVERTEYKTVTEERSVAQVKALYPFSGQEIEMAKGEVMFLLNKTNGDWWNVRKASGQDGFVPANYIKEIEPKQVLVQVRKPETIREMKKVKKSKMVLQSFNRKINTNKNKKPSNNESLETRMSRVTEGYQEVVSLSKLRREALENSIKLFNFQKECEDFEKWLNDREKQLNTTDETVSIENAKKTYEKLFSDLSASSKRLAEIDKLAGTINDPEVKQKQRQLHKQHENLLKLKQSKEKSLQGAISVELFNTNCDEIEVWIKEKVELIDNAVYSDNLKTLEALQRKHNNIERELVPISHKVQRVKNLASDVAIAYPREKSSVEAKLAKLINNWETLESKSEERKNKLADLINARITSDETKNLETFYNDCIANLNQKPVIKDVLTAEAELKKHADLGDNVRAKEADYTTLDNLSKQEPNEKLDNLKKKRLKVLELWREKGDWLQQVLDLQMFNREADYIDSQSQSHLNYLDQQEYGDDLEHTEMLLKRHNNLENSLNVQDERVKVFEEMAGKLELVHYDKDNIVKKLESVVQKRQQVKEKSSNVKTNLNKSLKYHLFASDVDDQLQWVRDKAKQAKETIDLVNVEKKLKKHQVFTGELRANEMRLGSINKAGNKLISEKNRPNDVEKLLSTLNNEWEELAKLSEMKLVKLRQAEAQQNYYKDIDVVNCKLDEIGEQLKSKDLGKDRRSTKELLKKHEILESELANLDDKVGKLVQLAEDLDYFDKDRVKGQAALCQEKLNALKTPANQRREALEELLKYYDYLFVIEAQMQWISEKSFVNEDLPNDLHEAQLRVKKQEKLQVEIDNHQPVVDKVLGQGQELVNQKHAEAKKIKSLSSNLTSAWTNLLMGTSERTKRLENSLKTQQYFSDAGEIESWMNEKRLYLESPSYGKDKETSVKLLTKHKAIELEIDSYTGLVKEMGNLAHQQMNNNPDKNLIISKQTFIEQQLDLLKKLANERRSKLIETMNKHEFFTESQEFIKWIGEQILIASSEEYGTDYEHLEVLRGKFFEFKNTVKINEARFEHLNSLAGKLIKQDDIKQEIDAIGELWSVLLSHMEAREMKLGAAGEIHRFNRDIADALARIQEKLNEIPEDVGRDVNSCETMLRAHETFENDLVVLEAQLQVLVDDAVRLSTQYTSNAANIKEEQSLVIENWNNLQSKTLQKKSDLIKSLEYHRFLKQYKDYMNWSTQTISTLEKQEKSDAQLQMTEHDRLKNEIDSHEDAFNSLLKQSTTIDNTKQETLKSQKNNLSLAWLKKKVYLDQLIDLEIFLRDCKALDSLSNGQIVIIKQPLSISTVEDALQAIKKHEAVEKLIISQDDKFSTLKSQGSKLIDQKHFESPLVKTKIEEVTSKRDKVKALAEAKKKTLDDQLLYLQYVRDVSEALIWIEEKSKLLKQLHSTKLEDKIKKLKKHQAFKAELKANENTIKSILEKSKFFNEKDKELRTRWEELLGLSAEFGKGLEEAQDLLDFQNEVEKTEQWIKDREILVQAEDTGKDYEHCLDIIKKLDDEKLNDLSKLESIARKLNNPEVNEKLDRLEKRFLSLKNNLAQYRKKLNSALEVHAFVRDVDDVEMRINEKLPIVNVEDLGRDLDSVEALIRKQDGIETEMKVIGAKLSSLKNNNYKEDIITSKMEKLMNSWDKLSEACFKRRQDLTDALQYQKFLKEIRLLEVFVEDAIDHEDTVINDIAQAEKLKQVHAEKCAEIQAKIQAFDDVERQLNRFIVEGHSYSEEFGNLLGVVKSLREKLDSGLGETRIKLDQSLELQVFLKECDEVEAVFSEFLPGKDIGESLSAIDLLIKEHEFDLRKFGKVERMVGDVDNRAKVLVSGSHYASEKITHRSSQIKQRWLSLKQTYETRTKTLEQSRNLQKFLLNLQEMSTWLHEKLNTALDENYVDLTNLQSKMQKHQAFLAEIEANSSRVNQVQSEGESLINSKHFASDLIEDKLDELKKLHEHLVQASNVKKDRLAESYQALLFNNNLDDIENWIDDVENSLSSGDNAGENLTQVGYLVKKWTSVFNQYKTYQEQIDSIKKTGQVFEQSNHFMRGEISERVNTVINKYYELEKPLVNKRASLEETINNLKYLRDLEEEMQYVTDKLALIKNSEYGGSVQAVHKLQKKHEGVVVEVLSKEKIINSLGDSNLLENYEELKSACEERKIKLAESLEAHQFYEEIAEAESFILEKKPYYSSVEFGNDEESVSSLVKKFENLSSFQPTIDKIIKMSEVLVAKNNYQKDEIVKKTDKLKESFSELQKLSDRRKQKLLDAGKYFKFLRETEESCEWIQEQMHIAGSEDYGRDVEHVEILIQKFEAFLQSASNSGENRVKIIENNAEQLIQEGHPDLEKINNKLSELKSLWDEFKELAIARQDALEGAKKVHMFDRTADETISWIFSKNVSEDFGKDMESIQALIRKHDVFLQDLNKAVKEQVELVKSEGESLAEEFPDAKEHIDCKLQETIEAWGEISEKARFRGEKLKQAEVLQEYFDKYRELLAYLENNIAKVQAVELGKSVESAEKCLKNHLENRIELEEFDKFFKDGEILLKDSHFRERITEKVNYLKNRLNYYEEIMKERKIIYEQNLDCLKYLRDCEQFEAWIESRENLLKDENLGESVSEVEEIIRRFEDFSVGVEVMGGKVGALERKTLIEEAFGKLKEVEEEKRKQMRVQSEKARLEEQKKIEVKKIEEQRRREEPSNTTSSWNFFGDRLRRGSDPIPSSSSNLLSVDDFNDPGAQRSESFRHQSDTLKKPKRTPSFTTRRRTQSFRKLDNLPPLSIDGFLERKQELNCGKRAGVRSWKTFYVVLCGQLMCFFKDQEDFVNKQAASSPINVYKAIVNEAKDYTKKKFVFRVKTQDACELLFSCENENVMVDWVHKIDAVSKLMPKDQISFSDLKSEATGDNNGIEQRVKRREALYDGDASSSEEDLSSLLVARPIRSREPLYANVNKISNSFHEPSPNRSKPPIPPRSSSIIKEANDVVDTKEFTREVLRRPQPPLPQQYPQQHQQYFHHNNNRPTSSQGYFHQNHNLQLQNQGGSLMRNNPYHSVYSAGPPAGQPSGQNNQQMTYTERSVKASSLPPQNTKRGSVNTVDSSSESDTSPPKKDSKRASTGLMGLFKRKKATQL